MKRFAKHYRSVRHANQAMSNWLWLTSLQDSGVTIPRASQHHATLMMDQLAGHHPTSETELEIVALALGNLHLAANRRLGSQSLNAIFHDDRTGISIADFITPRKNVLTETVAPLEEIVHRPVAIYKDTNVRNVLLLTDGDVAIIDFDDLTLAPVGYDLAKLIVSAAMTYGQITQNVIDRLLDAYNDALSTTDICTDADHFKTYLEIHGVLTTPYLGRNGYRFPWRHP